MDTCKNCGKPIYWLDDLGLWYHWNLADALHCPTPSYQVEPAAVKA